MSISYPNIALTTAWANLVAATPALSGKTLTIQNISPIGAVQIFFGGAAAPAADAGIQLVPGEAVDGTSDNIWAKAAGAPGLLSVLEN